MRTVKGPLGGPQSINEEDKEFILQFLDNHGVIESEDFITPSSTGTHDSIITFFSSMI